MVVPALTGSARKSFATLALLFILLFLPARLPAQKKPAPRKLPPKIIAALKEIHSDDGVLSEEPGPWVETFDLNGDGRPEYFVTDFCSPTGNCEFWILQETSRGVRELLKSDLVNFVCVRYTSSKGYRDIHTASHGSAFESGVTVFRFDGKNYQQAENYERVFQYDEKTGKTRQVEGPKKEPKCFELFRSRRPPVNLKDR